MQRGLVECKGNEMTEHKALSAFEQAALQKEVKQLKQRLDNLKAAARRVVADTLAAEPKLCIAEKPRGCATPGACSALTQIDDLGMRIEALVWGTVLRLNKALAVDTAGNKNKA